MGRRRLDIAGLQEAFFARLDNWWGGRHGFFCIMMVVIQAQEAVSV